MRRLVTLFTFLCAAGSVASAQTPDPQPAPTPDTAGQPPDQPPAQPEPPPAEPPPPEPAAPPLPELPKKLSVGKESKGATFVPGLNMQGGFVADTGPKSAADDTTASTSTFRLRRLEVSGAGDLIPNAIKYRFMFDLARVRDSVATVSAANATAGGAPVTAVASAGNSFSPLQDFFVTFTTDYVDFSLGQFKNTISWEGYQSATKIILPERWFVNAALSGLRDVGVRLDKTFKTFMYSLNLFNGAGQNQLDTNNQKDFSGRLEIYPIPGLTVAGAVYDSIGYRHRLGAKDRWEGDLRYESGPFLFQSEFIHFADQAANGGATINSQGGYVVLGYKIGEVGMGSWKGVLQPVVRFGYWDPNTDINLDPGAMPAQTAFNRINVATNAGTIAVNDERFDYEVGLNYYLRGNEMKIQISYDRQQYDNSSAKSANNEVIVATQLSY
jgi:hypothetical protein